MNIDNTDCSEQVSITREDPREFGAGIETTSKERAWQRRAAFWREKAMMLGYDPEKHNGANVDSTEPEFHFVNVKPVIVQDAPDAHQVWLDVGCQHFTVGEYLETKDEAEWFAGALRGVLKEICPILAGEEFKAITDEMRLSAKTFLRINNCDVMEWANRLNAVSKTPTQAPDMALVREAERYQILTADLRGPLKDRRDRILSRMTVMGKGATDADIDLLIEQSESDSEQP